MPAWPALLKHFGVGPHNHRDLSAAELTALLDAIDDMAREAQEAQRR